MLQDKKTAAVNFNDFYKKYYRKTFLFAKLYIPE